MSSCAHALHPHRLWSSRSVSPRTRPGSGANGCTRQNGCTAQRAQRSPEDGNDLFITPEFPTAEQAGSFAHDPALRDGMYARRSRR